MRIIHFAQFGPRSCGLYETAKDLILAERKLGIDAQLVDCDGQENIRIGLKDGEIVTQSPEISIDSDILIRHSAIPAKYQNIGVPVVMCLHGRPESTYRMSAASDSNILAAIANKVCDARYKAFVTFWGEYETAWRLLAGDKLHVLNAPVDLDYYSGGEDKNFSGTHKILIADIWRDDVIPLDCIYGAVRYIQKYEPTAKLHLVGLPTQGRQYEALKPILKSISNYTGSASGQMKDIRSWYKSCNVLVTPHTIATRIIRESLTSGLPVVAASGCKYTPFTANCRNPKDIALQIKAALADKDASENARQTALREFDSSIAAKQLIDICKNIINAKLDKRKIFIDIGGHLGESVRRFCRERADADEFEIYCFEPDPEIFKKCFDNIAVFGNVNCINAALSTAEGIRSLQQGKVNQGEGSTLMDGKLTGNLSGSIDIKTIDICRFIKSLGDFDYLVIKMNIEGGEYELLPYMTETDFMRYVNELYVQLHSLKFDTVHRIEMDKIELKWLEDMKRFETKVFARTKGMANFGSS